MTDLDSARMACSVECKSRGTIKAGKPPVPALKFPLSAIFKRTRSAHSFAAKICLSTHGPGAAGWRLLPKAAVCNRGLERQFAKRPNRRVAGKVAVVAFDHFRAGA